LRTTTHDVLKTVSFQKTPSYIDLPDLLDIQTKSYEMFLQLDIPEDERQNIGLEEVFNNVFPIEDSYRNYVLEYKSYYLGIPKHTADECVDRGVTYSAPLRVRLILHITDEENRNKFIHSIEQDVYFGNIPFMTKKGTFIINGAERVVVCQLHRSPGVFFDESIHPNGTRLFQARIIPIRGTWVDFTTDIHDSLFVIVDRRRKFPVTMLLRTLGFSSNKDIFKAFQCIKEVSLKKALDDFIGASLVEDIIDTKTGEIFYEAGEEISEEMLEALKKAKIKSINLVDGQKSFRSMLLLNTMGKDPTHNTEEALKVVYQLLRSSDPPNLETAQKFIERMFFSPKKYDLGEVGRYRLNQQFNLGASVENTVLTIDDILQVINYLIDMRKGERGNDDIDHLGNRRVRTVGEQLKDQFGTALGRMIRTIHERMNLREAESITPQDLINARIVTTVINTFFGTSQLSQFGDQTNPLAEITHKRRISALGPGGLTRERAGFEVRDVHYTHYGRLLASTDVHYLSADDEDRVFIAQSDAKTDKKHRLIDERIRVRIKGDFPVVTPDEVQYMEVAPNQILSVASALIPFVEHDDANRALMGSNMQRQSVPLMNPTAPLVGTGLEEVVARDSKSSLYSPTNGKVMYADSDRIIIKTTDFPDSLSLIKGDNLIELPLRKYIRSNQNTCQNQKTIVHEGDKVKKGQVLADGASTNNGELALGQNIRVAFMPWRGYNFEDAIVISERLVKEDIFTSVHINEIETEVRDTKRGAEELTAEIPNVSEEATKDLNEEGIIRIGAKVKDRDYLIGKVTPKGETDPTPEERLLRAIFGEKAGDVKDSSKKASPGIKGVVIKTKLFEKKVKRTRAEEREIINSFQSKARENKKQLKQSRDEVLFVLLKNQVSYGIRDIAKDRTLIKKGTKLTEKRLKGYDFEQLCQDTKWIDNKNQWEKIKTVWKTFKKEWKKIEDHLEKEIFNLRIGDELQPGILKLAKVFIANKRKIQIGDKVAGRHGNKGVISAIIPEEDMPFLEDGTPIDIILSPLGVPSRMNLGQLYETMLGRAGEVLGIKYKTPVFNGATPNEVEKELEKAGLSITGKTKLIDGRTGEEFDNPITVGNIYMMKLNHMVDDKMHARSTGPYSLITQQPLGGKAQFGGQRFGEMEVWALEAYGAAHLLREILTVKSDDVDGRSKVYNAIVRGDDMPIPGSPESFSVLIKELQGLCINVELN